MASKCARVSWFIGREPSYWWNHAGCSLISQPHLRSQNGVSHYAQRDLSIDPDPLQRGPSAHRSGDDVQPVPCLPRIWRVHAHYSQKVGYGWLLVLTVHSWLELMQSDRVKFDDGEKVDWVMQSVKWGLSEKNAACQNGQNNPLSTTARNFLDLTWIVGWSSAKDPLHDVLYPIEKGALVPE